MERGLLLRALLKRRRSRRKRDTRRVSLLVEPSLIEDEPLLRELRREQAASERRADL